jgi:hypothetical protein
MLDRTPCRRGLGTATIVFLRRGARESAAILTWEAAAAGTLEALVEEAEARAVKPR